MDASNPVADSTRMLISNIRGKQERIARQNLARLERIIKGRERRDFITLFDAQLEEDWEVAVRRTVKEIREKQLEMLKEGQEVSQIDVLEDVCHRRAPVPVCGLLLDGIAIHPPGTNESKGKVANVLTFGGSSLNSVAVVSVAQRFGLEYAFELAKSSKIYTRGTRKGLYNRCKKLLGRDCVRLSDYLSRQRFFKTLERCLPVRLEDLPNWGEEINSQVELLKTSFISSAGAPYWRSKLHSVDIMQDHLLPMVVDAIQNDTLDKLFSEEPEFWLCTLKNKEDRYEDPSEKTRPYLGMPWHWQALFSCLSQPFCRSLKLFTEDPRCRNAYGFSYANGGGDAIRAHVLKQCAKPGSSTYFVYGDDVDFYHNDRGVIKRVCPDFRQMDGSVDHETIDWTIDYIVECYIKQHGDTYANFWKSVAEEWKMFATAPLMVVDGDNIFVKKRRDGLISGVVGTTLFDTVKSITAYEEYLKALEHHPSLMNEEAATAFFATLGLEIKSGTWEVETVNFSEEPDTLFTNQKFLGMQLMYKQHKNNVVLVPTLPEKDWLEMFITPKRLDKSKSRLGDDRYAFDRIRGLMTTGAVFQPRLERFFNTVMLYDIDPLAIVMDVQACNGMGAAPELTLVLGEDFTYNSSMGWPDLEWALDLYSSPDKKIGAELKSIYKDGESFIREAYSRPKLQPDTMAVDVKTMHGIEHSVVLAVDKPVQIPAVVDASLMPSKPSIRTVTEASFRAKIRDLQEKYDSDKKAPQPKRKKPTLSEEIQTLLKPKPLPHASKLEDLLRDYLASGHQPEQLQGANRRPDMMLQLFQYLLTYAPQTLFDEWFGSLISHAVYPLHEAAAKFGVSPDRLRNEARKLGYYVVGPKSNELISGVPLAGAPEAILRQQKRQEVENTEALTKVGKQLKDATIEQVPKLKSQQKALLTNITRSTELPAAALLDTAPKTLRLRKVPNLVIPRELTVDRHRIVANEILAHNKLRATREETKFPDKTWNHKFFINGKEILKLDQFGGKAAWLYFYQFVINWYRKDTTTLQKGEDWNDYIEREAQARTLVYRNSAGPVLIQRPGLPVELIGTSDRLEERITEAGKAVFCTYGGSTFELKLHRGTLERRRQRLERLLGETISLEKAQYIDFPSHKFNYLKQYNVRQKRKEDAKKQTKRDSGGESSARAQAPAQKQKTETPEHVSVGDVGSSGSGQRLLRNRHPSSQRQGRKFKRPNQHNTQGLARNTRPKRGHAVAKVAPRVPAN
nr:MAG: RNA-dependent RNA polymerase [Wufeng shrew permutotetravirus 5]